MTAFTTLSSASLAVGKPLTSTIALALRDNPVAIGEADASVALGLLPTVLLGTLTTTSGTVQTLSSLVLTPYRFLLFWFDGVSTGATATLSVGSLAVSSISNISYSNNGHCWVNLSTGVAFAPMAETTTLNMFMSAGATGYTTASTSVSVSTSSGAFDAGNVKVYGVK